MNEHIEKELRSNCDDTLHPLTNCLRNNHSDAKYVHILRKKSCIPIHLPYNHHVFADLYFERAMAVRTQLLSVQDGRPYRCFGEARESCRLFC